MTANTSIVAVADARVVVPPPVQQPHDPMADAGKLSGVLHVMLMANMVVAVRQLVTAARLLNSE